MDFLDPKKKRAHRHRLYLGYGLIGLTLAIATFILVYAAYGYGIDRHTGSIIQNGLIVVDAHPESATILVNKNSMGTTANRLVLPSGNYSIELQRSGYRSWSHQVSLEGGSIEQLVYPFLFPSKLVTKTIQQFPSVPAMATQSPDRHWLIVQSPDGPGNFNVVDLNNNKNPVTTISLASDVITAAEGKHTYEAVEWSTDNVHVLLKHTYPGGSEFIMMDRSSPQASLNINKLFPDKTFTAISLRDKKPDQLYLMNAADGNLLVADTSAHTATLLLQHVLSYKSYQSDTILFATKPNATSENTEIHMWRNGQDYFLRVVPNSAVFLLEMTQFNGHFYVASGSSADGRAYLYKDPFDDYGHTPARTPQPFRVLIVEAAQYVSFSNNARFIAVQGGSSFAIYDAETDRQFRYDTKLPLSQGQQAIWMDGHRMSLISQGSVNVFDFDGLNIQTLSPSLAAFSPFFDKDYTAMFTLAPAPNAPDKTALQRTELKVLPAGATSQ